MRTATIISLGASAVLGLGALVVAKTMAPPKSPASQLRVVPAMNGTPVVVAKHDLAYGAKLDAGELTLVNLPAADVPAGAFGSIAAAVGQPGSAPVALTPIAAHEVVLPAKISGPGARASLSAGIADGMRAYTIRVSDTAGVGGHALPGDRVDVVLTRDMSSDHAVRRMASFLLIQNVRVLGVDLNLDQTSTHSVEPRSATLEVSPQDAEKLALAPETGTLSLALRRNGSAETAAAPAVLAANLTPGHGMMAPGEGETPRATAKPKSSGRRAVHRTGAPAFGAGVIIVNGGAPSTVKPPAAGVAAGA
jgi:pilus assembly protein CpaB